MGLNLFLCIITYYTKKSSVEMGGIEPPSASYLIHHFSMRSTVSWLGRCLKAVQNDILPELRLVWSSTEASTTSYSDECCPHMYIGSLHRGHQTDLNSPKCWSEAKCVSKWRLRLSAMLLPDIVSGRRFTRVRPCSACMMDRHV